MTAAYRLKGIGWFAVIVGVILGCYLVSLRVAAEHKKLDDMNLAIASAQRDIRALETEFDTRANLAQLEKWNGDALALAAPTAAQFIPDDRALAALDPNGPSRSGGATVQTAALIVPALTVVPPTTPATPAPAAAPKAATPASQVRMAAAAPPRAASVLPVAPSGRSAPAVARAVEAARGVAAVARVRPQAVAMLDRKLLSDSTFGDVLSSARREARR